MAEMDKGDEAGEVQAGRRGPSHLPDTAMGMGTVVGTTALLVAIVTLHTRFPAAVPGLALVLRVARAPSTHPPDSSHPRPLHAVFAPAMRP
ncbi:hypothetical protein HBH45_160720 [Parastagonospora nodorum]|nr:hypothetical protein HBH45_160720 [Parastagonospora nodorum]